MASASTSPAHAGPLAKVARHLQASASEDDAVSASASSSAPGVAPSPVGVPGTARRAPREDDVLILSAARTPIGKAKRGSFKDLTPDLLLRPVLEAVMERCPGLRKDDIADVVIGNVRAPGSGAEIVRMAALLAGVPVTAGATACNRQCSSGLQAIAAAAGMIRLGAYDAAIAGGFESMSQLEQQPPTMDYSSLESDKRAADCAIPMGDTSEVVAKRYSVSREDQDRVAAESQRRAEAAQTGGLYDDEIVPVTVPPEDGEGPGTTVTKDDGIRAGTTAEKLARLRPAFDPEGASTAGNSSQVSDGAAAVLLMRRGRFDALGLKGRVQPLGVLRSFVVVGVEPDEMGVGPAYAIPPALRRAGVRSDEIDAFEINEAFASQYLYCLRALKLDDKKVNPLGGAIALGHPLGCTGCRQVVTLLHHLRRTKGKYGVVSMCIGTGMGAAAVFEREE